MLLFSHLCLLALSLIYIWHPHLYTSEHLTYIHLRCSGGTSDNLTCISLRVELWFLYSPYMSFMSLWIAGAVHSSGTKCQLLLAFGEITPIFSISRVR